MSLNLAEREPAFAGTPLVDAPDLREPAGRDAFALTLDLRHAGPRRVTLRYEWQGRTAALATIGRDLQSLREEHALEALAPR